MEETTTAVDTAVQGVQATTLAGSAPVHDMSITGMFLNADIIVQTIIVLLFMASFWSWAIMIDKFMRFKAIKQKSAKFESEFWQSEALDKFYERTKKRAPHPMSLVFMAAMEEWYRTKVRDLSTLSISAKQALRDRMNQIMLVARNREIDKLEKHLGFLATIGSSAPFIGLFGTVWGIMNSFQSIAASKNTSLAVVAPGIAEALFATAIGLFAAIPAVIAYNKFSNELDNFTGKLEDFSVEFNTLLSREIDGGL